ncbi:MAG: hypothetical protein GX833_00155 [Clostridium sp.]|nr:hypothetical protein [Clostridium sp.]
MLKKGKSTDNNLRREAQEEKIVKYILIGLFSVIVLFLLYMIFSLWGTP